MSYTHENSQDGAVDRRDRVLVRPMVVVMGRDEHRTPGGSRAPMLRELGGSWSGRTVARWVDEVLRSGAAACEDGEDFRLEDVA